MRLLLPGPLPGPGGSRPLGPAPPKKEGPLVAASSFDFPDKSICDFRKPGEEIDCPGDASANGNCFDDGYFHHLIYVWFHSEYCRDCCIP